MALFDYVMLLVSVVLSLGLARLLETHARLLKRGAAVRWSATYLAWFAIMGAMHVDLWATLWSVHEVTEWAWSSILGFFFQAVALFYGAVLLAPDDADAGEVDLWRFHLANRRRYIAAIIAYTLMGCYLAYTFLPTQQFVPAIFSVGIPMIVLCGVAMVVTNARAQATIAFAMVAWVGWYFVRFLPDFHG